MLSVQKGSLQNPEIKVTTEARLWYKGNTEERALWKTREDEKSWV